MFGLASFAQSSFAATGASFYPLSITEDSNIADLSTQQWAALASQTEAFSIIDDNSFAGLFVTSINENLTLDTSLLIGSSISASVTETLTSNDNQTIVAQFAQSVTENNVLAEIETGYFAIVNSITEPISSVQDANTQQSTFGQTIAENNQTIYVYEVTGKLFNCQRRFTIDSKNTVTGFVSTCWD